MLLLATCLVVGLIWALLDIFFRKPPSLRTGSNSEFSKISTGIVALKDAGSFLILKEATQLQLFEITYIRQSGNVDRQKVVTSRRAAISEIEKQFSRMNEPSVRIWLNTPLICDLRRPYGSFSGRNEGKKIGSVVVSLVSSNQS